MKLRLWLKYFLLHILFFLLLTSIVFYFLSTTIPAIQLEILLTSLWLDLPLWSYLLASIVVMALLSTFIFIHYLIAPYERIETKITLLNLGKYDHQILVSQPVKNWHDPFNIIDQEIEGLRLKILNLSSDLQEFSAPPTFVGTETKEEIIEHERQRIARELHDSVSQQLFAAMMLLSAVNETTTFEEGSIVSQRLLKIEEIINSAQTEMRALLLHLRPIELSNKSLKEGITLLLKELEPKIPQKVTYELDSIKMESGIEDHLFRIVQESISNTLRHAKASKFEVYLKEVDGGLSLKILDDGKGFDPNKTHKVGSYGILNMKERISSLGGTLKILSLPNQGTEIDIKIPLKRKSDKNDSSISSR